MSLLAFTSALLGWAYTAAWSFSFYPQALLNWRRKSTAGTTIDFPLLNTIGFTAYFISNAALYFSDDLRHQHEERHGSPPTVRFNDIIFALHAATLSLVTAAQYPLYRSPSRPSRPIALVILGCFAGVVAVAIAVLTIESWEAVDLVSAIGYVKLVVSIVKYIPQMLANYRNRSTVGWAIDQILLDFAGGGMSVAQLFIDAYLLGSLSAVLGNPVKFALGNLSMAYDVLFMTQHYVWYADNNGENSEAAREEEREGLV